MNIYNKTIFFLLLILLGSLYFCNADKATEIKVPGIVDGDIISVNSKTAGTVTAIDLKEGEKVTKNKTLLKIDSRIIENKLAEIPLQLKSIDIKIEELKNIQNYAYANKKYINRQINRFRRLLKNRSISGEKLESFQLKLKKVNTEIFGITQKTKSLEIEKEKLINKDQHLKLLLEDYIINSPVNGVIIEKFISIGENVFPSKPLADILDLNSLYIEVFIEGEEISKIKLEDPVQIFLDGIRDPFKGKVSYFGRKAEFSPKYVISEKERKALLYLVKIKIERNKEFYKLGMPVTVIF